jgi:hypothetical protein
MIYFLFILATTALFGFVMPRIGIRIVKDVCPQFFGRLSEFVAFGFFHALEGFDMFYEHAREDGEEMELELFKPLIKTSLILSLCWSILATLFSGLGTFGILSGALLASLFPTAGLGLAMIIIGTLLLRLRSGTWSTERSGFIRSKIVIIDQRSGSMKSELVLADELPGTLPYSCADRVCDYVLDHKEQFDKDPVGFFAFVDRFYDMAKRALFNVWGRISNGK